MDKIAKHLGMDPAEIRLKNPTYAGDSTEAGAYFGSCSMVECVEEAVKKGRWHEKRAESGRHGNKLRGTGLSTLVFTGSGGRYYSYASCDSFIKIAEDGLVSIITNSCELGQGIQTVVMQIVMEVLGVKAERIRIIDDNTDTVPYDLGAWGSRQTFVIGNSVKAAAENIKKDIIAAAARMLEKNDNLEIIDEKIYIDYGNNRYVETDLTYDQVINYCYYFLGTPLSSKGSHIDREARFTRGRKDFVKDIVTFTFACQMATVEIDIDTGKIEVVDFFATQETGTTINPLTCSGQIDGAIVQGIGMTLYERVYRENGIQKTLGYVDYKVPTALDVPTIDNEFIENYDDPFGPFGAKGIGESSLCPTPAAINNAIYDATGLEFNGLPILPEDVLRALKEKGIK